MSQSLAARCYAKLGEPERAVSVMHTCAEGLLQRDYLLSAIAACKQALLLSPTEKRVKETLWRIHTRAARTAQGRAAGPPPLPPETLYEGDVKQDLMSLSGARLSDQAIAVLASAPMSDLAISSTERPRPATASLPPGASTRVLMNSMKLPAPASLSMSSV